MSSGIKCRLGLCDPNYEHLICEKMVELVVVSMQIRPI